MGKIVDNSASETAEQIEVQAGRREPFTQVGDWILLAPLKPQSRLLYWALKAHVNTTRGDNEVWPTQDMLAEIMGLSEGRKIRPFLKELVEIDAVSIRKAARYAGGMRTRNIYVVHGMPPEEYDGVTSLKTFYARRKDRLKAEEEARDAARGVQTELDLAPAPGRRGKKAA